MSTRADEGTMDGDDPTRDLDTHQSQAAQRHYDPDGNGDLTTAIIYAIAEAEAVSPREVKSPPLYEVVDASAIEDAFFGRHVAGDPRQGNGAVEFQYTDYLVKVRSDGWIAVYERTETDRS